MFRHPREGGGCQEEECADHLLRHENALSDNPGGPRAAQDDGHLGLKEALLCQ